MRRAPHPATLTLLIALMVLAWTFNFLIGKIGLRHFDPFTLASFRVVLAALIMPAIFWATATRRDPRQFQRQDFWNFAQLGLLGIALNQVLFTIGLNYTTVGHSSLIISTGPISVLLMARLVGLERLTSRKLLGMVLSFSGVAVLTAEQGLSAHTATLTGDLITLVGSFSFALYTVLGKKVAEQYDSVAMNTFGYLAGAVLMLPLAVRQGLRLNWAAVAWPGWAALAYMAVFGSVAAYLIYYWALRHVAASRLIAFSYFHPVLATLLGVLLLGERVTTHLVVGGGLVLLGVYLTEVGPGEKITENHTDAKL